MMRFFRMNKLCRRIADGSITSKKKLVYLLGGILLTLLNNICNIFFSRGMRIDSLFILYWLYQCILVSIAIVMVYRVNNRGDGKDFIERYVILIFPLNLSFGIISVLIGIVCLLFYSTDPSLINKILESASVVWALIDNVLLYWLLYANIKKVNDIIVELKTRKASHELHGPI